MKDYRIVYSEGILKALSDLILAFKTHSVFKKMKKHVKDNPDMQEDVKDLQKSVDEFGISLNKIKNKYPGLYDKYDDLLDI